MIQARHVRSQDVTACLLHLSIAVLRRRMSATLHAQHARTPPVDNTWMELRSSAPDVPLRDVRQRRDAPIMIQ